MKILDVKSAKLIRSCTLLSEKTSERNSKQLETFLHVKIQKQLLKEGYCKFTVTNSDGGKIAKEYEERKHRRWMGIDAWAALKNIQKMYQEAGYYTGLTNYAEQLIDETSWNQFVLIISPFAIDKVKIKNFDFYEPNRETTWQDEEEDF